MELLAELKICQSEYKQCSVTSDEPLGKMIEKMTCGSLCGDVGERNLNSSWEVGKMAGVRTGGEESLYGATWPAMALVTKQHSA